MLTIDRCPVDEVDCIFEDGIHFYVFYFLYFLKERYMDMLEEQLRSERDTDLEVGGVS